LLLLGVLGLPIAHAQVSSSRGTAGGERIFQQCSGCHGEKVGENKAGPSLKGAFSEASSAQWITRHGTEHTLEDQEWRRWVPSYEQVLSAKELDQLIVVLKESSEPVVGGRRYD